MYISSFGKDRNMRSGLTTSQYKYHRFIFYFSRSNGNNLNEMEKKKPFTCSIFKPVAIRIFNMEKTKRKIHKKKKIIRKRVNYNNLFD